VNTCHVKSEGQASKSRCASTSRDRTAAAPSSRPSSSSPRAVLRSSSLSLSAGAVVVTQTILEIAAVRGELMSESMLVVALVIVLAPLAWLAIKRMQHADPAARRAGLRWVIAGLGAALALRVGLAAPVMLRVALCLLAIGALAVWLRRRGQGGEGPGDDGRDSPVDPGPDPHSGRRAAPPPERLDPEAFDRARGEWEHTLEKHAPD